MNTIEEFESKFNSEEIARDFIKQIRWGKFASCPYCGNEKVYFIEKGTRFKCANPNCSKKFSVISKSVFEASKLPLCKILKLFFLYAKSRGKISPFQMAKEVNIQDRIEFFAREKIDFIWKYIDRYGKDILQIINDMIKTMADSYEKYQYIKILPYYNSPFTIKDIDDISDVEQYNKLLRYTRYYINVYCKWIYMDFASPEDVLSETFIWMKENDIKEYNAEAIIKYIQKTVNKMWSTFLNTHPRHSEDLRIKNKLFKETYRLNLHPIYLTEVIYRQKDNVLTRKEIRKNKELLHQQKMKILSIRKE